MVLIIQQELPSILMEQENLWVVNCNEEPTDPPDGLCKVRIVLAVDICAIID